MPSSECYCDKTLSEYVLVYVENPEAYVNHDWVREHGVLVDFAERTHPLTKYTKHKEIRIIYAYTVAEAYRLIAFEEGDKAREPLHRILNEDKEEIHKCLVKDESITVESIGQALMERFLSEYDNARLSGASSSELSGTL